MANVDLSKTFNNEIFLNLSQILCFSRIRNSKIALMEDKFVSLEGVIISIFSWGSPVGLGIFFIGLGYLLKCIFSLGRVVDKEKKTTNPKG